MRGGVFLGSGSVFRTTFKRLCLFCVGFPKLSIV